MSNTTQIYLVLTCIAVVIAIVWTPLRTALGGLISAFLTPAFLATLNTIFLWTVWFLKTISRSHSILIKNLIMPRKVIFPSLQDDDDRKL
jgi:hypothetical protein